MHHAQVVKSLEAAQHLKLQLEKMKVEEQKVFITNTTTCAVTNQAIGDKPFARYPNGGRLLIFAKLITSVVITTPTDGSFNPHVCPLTGRDFRKHPYTEVLEDKLNKK